MKEIISCKNIIKSFGVGAEKRNILDQITVTVNEGEFVSIMGPSGSGKSTLLFAMSGMDCIDSGKVYFCGKELSEYKEDELANLRRTQMGFVFQQPTMLKNLNIIDNIIFPVMRDNKKEILKITEKARLLMKKTGIAELEKFDITQVSGGQLQRAGICRALMNNPKIVFGDEPTGALNSKSAQEIMDIFDNINKQGTTITLVTHDVKIAARTERILFLCDGQIVSELKLPKFSGVNIDARIDKILDKMYSIGI